ncbi:ATP-binding cassette domain-containing protein [Acidaminobacter sp. JC074]|uniref:ATP-binding cassette domain-containing protein n=1 Tax=Acidaminobacter sp. JC074 TaxID=2530199 RepID=UPI001F1017E6|nr:ATP-binding cassette domain-containing protein [Acidaminobacter sp. JC074]MCH4891125.1 ATP-binding cassette domain-containing protein [Acidaminobacter sp. JC074]
MLELINIKKNYQIRKDKFQTVLKGVNVKFSNKGFVSILGSSGNGKTTLLNVIGGLDTIDSGMIKFNDEEVTDFEQFRRERIGYVFQQFNLVEHLTIVDNVIVSMDDDVKDKIGRAKEILIDMGLEANMDKHPKHLSGGQQQRVAIARMIAKDVDIIICDEPTGSLDDETEKSIVEIIKKLSKEKLVLFVTHNRHIAETYSDRIIHVKSGQLLEDDMNKKDIHPNTQKNKRTYKKNIFWLARKSLTGRKKFSLKYLFLTTFILLVASGTFILEGEFFKRYMHESAIEDGINVLYFENNEIETFGDVDNVTHITPYYDLTIGVAASNYESTRKSTESLVENVTGNDYIKSIITDGRFPENPYEILMTAEGAILLLKDLNIGGERLYDQYLTGEVTSDYVFSLVDWKQFFIAEYGMPRVKIVGLLDDKKIAEDYHKVYFVDGFFDLFEYPGGVKYDHIKVYKDNLYRQANESIIEELSTLGLSVNEDYKIKLDGIYRHIDSFLNLSKISLYLIIGIALVSFLSLQYTSLFERKFEIGLYRALGYSKSNILRVFASEMFTISLIALILVLLAMNLFSLIMLSNLDYYTSMAEILDTLNIGWISLGLFGIISLFTLVSIYSGNYLILRKSVLSNINNL